MAGLAGGLGGIGSGTLDQRGVVSSNSQVLELVYCSADMLEGVFCWAPDE